MIDPVDFKLKLQEIAAESIGWISLQVGTYLHVGFEETEIIEQITQKTSGFEQAPFMDSNSYINIFMKALG